MLHLQEELVPGYLLHQLAWVGRVELDAEVEGEGRRAFQLLHDLLRGVEPVRLVGRVEVAEAKVSRLHQVEMVEDRLQQVLPRRGVLYLLDEFLFVQQHHLAVVGSVLVAEALHPETRGDANRGENGERRERVSVADDSEWRPTDPNPRIK